MGELTIPFCSQCFREIVDFDCFVETPCKHCFCWGCIKTLRMCPIDNTPWNSQAMAYSQELKEAVDAFTAWRHNTTLEKVFELINVNGVECRLTEDRRHNRTVCPYHHPIARVNNSLEGWECPNCRITVSAQSKKCGFCDFLKPSVPANVQEWACAYCTVLNSMETYVCSACGQTNNEVRTSLKNQGKSMKLCPKCRKQAPFSAEICSYCSTPITAPVMNPAGPYWNCSNCGSKCQQMDSWICDNCYKTDVSQKKKLLDEGKEMNHCPKCKKLVPYNSSHCGSCFALVPRNCGTCGNTFTSEKCENCEIRRQTGSSQNPVPRVATRSSERNLGSPVNISIPVSGRRTEPRPSVEVSESVQEWTCVHCTALNSMETFVCSACGRTNNEVRTYLESQGKSMKLCPKCRKQAPFSAEICSYCSTPITAPVANLTGPYWNCSNCGSKCQQMDSWICDKCDKTDNAQRKKLRDAGKEMSHCPNCKKLVPYNIPQCWSCFVIIPRKCGTCGRAFTSETCENCETRRHTRSSRSRSPVSTFTPVPQRQAKPMPSIRAGESIQEWACVHCAVVNSLETYVCSACGQTNNEIRTFLKSQGKSMKSCPNCMKPAPFSAEICSYCSTPITAPVMNPTGPYWSCSNCRSKCQLMDSWICDKCDKADATQRKKLIEEGKEMYHCLNCKKFVQYNSVKCGSCFSPVPRKCGACGIEFASEKCENCEARRRPRSSRSPKPRATDQLYSDSSVSAALMKSSNPSIERLGNQKPVYRGRGNQAEERGAVQRQQSPSLRAAPLFSANYTPATQTRLRRDGSSEKMSREEEPRGGFVPMYGKSVVMSREGPPDNRKLILGIAMLLAFLLFCLLKGKI